MKKIIIFGGTGGLGSLITKLFIASGHEVISLGSKDVDIRNHSKVEWFFSENPKFDVVINLAGINSNHVTHKIVTENDFNCINDMLDVNIKGNINIISNCLPYMRENYYGRIITISSVLAEKPVAGTGIYAGTKGFIDSFIKAVALENASRNITINSLQLGYFDGGLTYKIPENLLENIKNQIPLKRWGRDIELYNVIKMLIDTPYITGTNIKINGGIDF